MSNPHRKWWDSWNTNKYLNCETGERGKVR